MKNKHPHTVPHTVAMEEGRESEEKWLKYYSSFHQILLVGDGDFSFSLSLATAFASASNIVATSLDSYDVVIKKYKNARSNLETLGKLGANLLHGVDATNMKLHTDLQMRKFDRIIYNFPHAGFHGNEFSANVIKKHRNLLHGFFRNAGGMLRANGEIHVNHKTSHPFSRWNLEELAGQNSLALIECVDFKKEEYPGYNNKRGDGARCDKPFPLGACSTFKFRFSPTANKTRNLVSPCLNPQQLQVIQQQPASVAFAQPSLNPVTHTTYVPGHVSSPPAAVTRNDCSRIFREYSMEEEREEKWLKHYSSFHQILSVGDGDFSFSISLARAFGSASNIVATSLDSYDVVIKKYKNARSNLETLGKLGAYLLHGVDATKMKLHTDLQMRKFDRIIFNFPHAGFHGNEHHGHLIRMHRNLVHDFFRNAGGMLRANGEIHVLLKTSGPSSSWNLEELAGQNSLALIECVDFKKEDYPGYNHKRGDGAKCDKPFRLGPCSTFKFRFSPTANKTRNLVSPCFNPQQLEVIQPQPVSVAFAQPALINPQQLQVIHQQPVVAFAQPSLNPVTYTNYVPRYVSSPPVGVTRNHCTSIFREYFNYLVETFKNPNYSVTYLVETLKLGLERYEAEKPGRPFTDYLILLIQLFTI